MGPSYHGPAARRAQKLPAAGRVLARYNVDEAASEVVILLVGRKEKSFMDAKVIPLHELQADTEGLLRRAYESGNALVVELPDRRRLRIEPLDEGEDLIDDLIEHDPAFQELLNRSAGSPRKPFPPPGSADGP